MTYEQLAEISARCAAATPGPWAYDGAHDEITTPNRESDYWLICSECRTAPNDAPMDNFGHQFSPDFEFIAHAREDVPALLVEVARLRAVLAGEVIMFLAGTTVYNIVTDHPKYPHEVIEGGRNYSVYADREVAERIAAAWNSYHTDTNTPNPWPFYVLECVVKSPGDAKPAADDDDDSLQLVLF